MPITPINTPAKLNQQTGMVLAYFGYDRSTTPDASLKAKLGNDWIGVDNPNNSKTKLEAVLGQGYNTQFDVDGKVQNSFNVFVNEKTGQIAISFKGSDVGANFKSDLLDNGAVEFNNISGKAQAALAAIRTQYPNYQVFTVGHSLGGGMAQTFAIKNGLDAQVYNSLPIARQSVDGSYFGGSAGFDAAFALWKTSGHQVQDVRTGNDIATFFYNNETKGVYVSSLTGQAPTILPGTSVPDFIKALSLIPISPTAVLFGAAYGRDHVMEALIDATQGVGTDPITGKFIIPEGQSNLVMIPTSVREQFQRFQNTSPISEVRPDGANAYIIQRQDGSEQRVNLDGQTGAVRITQPNGSGGTLELRMNSQDKKAPVEFLDLDADGKLRTGAKVGVEGTSLTSRTLADATDGAGLVETIETQNYRVNGQVASNRKQDVNLDTGNGHLLDTDANGEVVNDFALSDVYRDETNTGTLSASVNGIDIQLDVELQTNGGLAIGSVKNVNGAAVQLASAGELTMQEWEAFGLSTDSVMKGDVGKAAADLIKGLDPATQATTGHSAPQVTTTDEGGGLRVRTVELGNGTTLSTKRDGDRIVSISQTVSTSLFEKSTQTWQVNDDGQQVLRSTITQKYGLDGVGYQGTEVDHIERKIYKLNGNNSGVTRTLDESATLQLQISQAASVAQDLLGFGKTLASKAPDAYKFASGLVLLNKLTNLDTSGKVINAKLGTSSTVAQGALSLYQLDQAFNGSGNDLAKFSAVGNAINFANITFNAASNGAFVSGSAAAGLNTALNGGAGGWLGSGTVGALPALGLIVSLQSGDPIGIATSIGTLLQGSAFLTTNPLGWMLIGASILQTLFADHSVPKAWGVANVSYGNGFENLHLQVNAGGDSFGTERARQGLQGIADHLQTNVVDSYNANHSPDQQVGLIAQRMPGLAWRASDAGDPGFKITEIDPLTGAQTYPYRRFDDSGVPFSANPGAYQVDPTDPNQRGGFNEAMVMSAYKRQAIAPLWEVKTAKLQGEAGDANAGLTEEERAAKAGLSAALDTAYAASHSADANAQNKRVGSFMAVGLDLDGSNTISTTTLAQTATLNNGMGLAFDWDGQGYKKRVGGVNSNDGLLVLDRDFNSSVDNSTELLSNPLVSDVAKGLRSLATWDTNGDGRIDAHDPLYQQLKVWQDFDQDGNNTHFLNVIDASGPHSVLAQDESNGVKELRSLAALGITAIDYANNRYEFDSGLRTSGVASGQISYASAQTVKLDAETEGVRYTPVGAGIQVEATDGSSLIQITQVHSEARMAKNNGWKNTNGNKVPAIHAANATQWRLVI